MRIRRPRGITVQQLMVVTAIGFLGGVYIWKPLILKYRAESTEVKENSDNLKEKEPVGALTSSSVPANTVGGKTGINT